MKAFLPLKLNAFFVVLLFGLTFQTAFSQENNPSYNTESPLPAPTGFVNDYAGVLDANTKQNLENKLTEFKQQTNPSVEIGVAIVKTTGDRDIFDYSLAVARGWKMGSKQTDNPSALLFIAIDDRKYFTQVSRDLEDELPDGLVGQLQRQYLVPAFKRGDYSKGVSDTIDAYLKTIKAKQSGVPVSGETKQAQEKKGSGLSCNTVICLVILFILLLSIFSRGGKNKRDKNDRDRWGGGGGFGGGSALPWIIGSILASGSGSSRGSSSSWGGGGSAGGGFGGCGGGGDFGGGGAGGGW